MIVECGNCRGLGQHNDIDCAKCSGSGMVCEICGEGAALDIADNPYCPTCEEWPLPKGGSNNE